MARGRKSRKLPPDTVSYVNQHELGEVLPTREERQAEWERILGLRAGVLAPKVVAALHRQRDGEVRRSIDAAWKASSDVEA